MTSSFPFKKFGICTIAVMAMCFYAEDSFGQSEQERVDLENSKRVDKPILEDSTPNSQNLSPKILTPKTEANAQQKTLVKRDLPAGGVEKDPKKEEVTPSTLSFNIFLYIVDKFKAD